MSIDKGSALAATWVMRLAVVLTALSVILLFGEVIALNAGWRRDYTTKFLLVPLFWTSGAMALLGIVGLLVTGRFKWLWLVPGAASLVVMSFLAALSKFNWGM